MVTQECWRVMVNNVSRKLTPLITYFGSQCFSDGQCLVGQLCLLFPSLLLVFPGSCLLLHSDPAEKPCLRPFLTLSASAPYLFVRLFGLFLRRPLSLTALPLCRPHHNDPLDAQVIKVTRAHTECWGHPNRIDLWFTETENCSIWIFLDMHKTQKTIQ